MQFAKKDVGSLKSDIIETQKIGDFIEGAGVAGNVEEIQIFTTQHKTPDNKTIIVPNAKMTGDNINSTFYINRAFIEIYATLRNQQIESAEFSTDD